MSTPGAETFQLVLEAGYPVFRLMQSSGEWRDLLRSTVPLSVGAWQHILVTYEAGVGSLSVAGSEVATTDVVMPVLGSYNVLYVGARQSTGIDTYGIQYEFSGELDELAIFRR